MRVLLLLCLASCATAEPDCVERGCYLECCGARTCWTEAAGDVLVECGDECDEEELQLTSDACP